MPVRKWSSGEVYNPHTIHKKWETGKLEGVALCGKLERKVGTEKWETGKSMKMESVKLKIGKRENWKVVDWKIMKWKKEECINCEQAKCRIEELWNRNV